MQGRSSYTVTSLPPFLHRCCPGVFITYLIFLNSVSALACHFRFFASWPALLGRVRRVGGSVASARGSSVGAHDGRQGFDQGQAPWPSSVSEQPHVRASGSFLPFFPRPEPTIDPCPLPRRPGFAHKSCLSVQKGPDLVGLETRNRTLRTIIKTKSCVILGRSQTCLLRPAPVMITDGPSAVEILVV